MPSFQHLWRAPYACASCIRSLERAAPRTSRSYASSRTKPDRNDDIADPTHHSLLNAARRVPSSSPNAYSTTTKKPLRLAIIGSGPAGFYTAHGLMKKVNDVVVDMYERLPVPYGLVRFGVAPDHPEVKNCQDTFEDVASSSRFNYIGNVAVGHDLALADMKPHYDAILFAYGAMEDRQLGIPGENLSGVHSAREFVGWYNGVPHLQDYALNLADGHKAVLIGHGNVALDVARILLTPVDKLRKTDITEQALEVLSRSRVKSVKVVGRRGPLQAAFTVKEARELMKLPRVGFESKTKTMFPPEVQDMQALPRVQRRVAEVLKKGSQADIRDSERKWGLLFMRSPKEIHGGATGSVNAVEFQHTAFAPETDPLSKDARVILTKETSHLSASYVFKAVGYKSTALPGLSDLGVPFDNKLGIIPNDAYGRVISSSNGPGELTAGHVSGLYCAGWVKRGPTGVILSTMQDAFESAHIIAQDWANEVPFLNTENGENKSTGLGWDGVKDKVLQKGVAPVDWEGWKRIDKAERARGKELGKTREKILKCSDQLKVAHGVA